MSELNIRNHGIPQTGVQGIEPGRQPEQSLGPGDEGNEALSLNEKLQSTDIREQMQSIEDRLKMSTGSAGGKLSAQEKLLFLTNIDDSLISSLHSKHAPHLSALQQQAADCDLPFKQKFIKLIDSPGGLKNLNKIYAEAKSPAQKAYADLATAYMLANNFCTSLAKQFSANIDPQVMLNLQGLTGELMACGAKDAEAAVERLRSQLKLLPDEVRSEAHETLKNFMSTIRSIAAHKLNAAEDIRKLHAEYQNAAQNMQNGNPAKVHLTEPRYLQETRPGAFPASCGISGVLADGGEIERLCTDIRDNLKGPVDKFITLAAQTDLILKSPNQKGVKIAALYQRIDSEAGGNQILKQKVEAFSRETFERVGGRIARLLDNPVSNANLAAELTRIGDEIGRCLLPEHSQPLAKIVGLNLSKLPVNMNGLEETKNLTALRDLMARVSSDDSLKPHFADLMSVLSLSSFDLRSFAILGGAKHNSPPDETAQASTKVLTSMCRVLSGSENGSTFIDSLADGSGLKHKSTVRAFSAITAVLSGTGDELLTQKCGKYINFGMIRQAALRDLQEADLHVWNVPPTPEEVKADPEKYRDFTIMQALSQIVNAPPSKLDSQIFRTVVEAAAAGRLPHARAIWNSVLGAAYHTEMAAKLESGAISSVPREVYSLSAAAAAPGADRESAATSGEKARDDFNASLSEEVKNLMQSGSAGLFRKSTQTRDYQALAGKLNSLGGTQILKAMSNESHAGRALLATDELRQELSLTTTNILTQGVHSLDRITDPDELLKLGISKSTYVEILNTKYSRISQEYQELIAKKDSALQNPVISGLLESQNLQPGQIPRGEDVAVTLVTLRDNLIDDLAQFTPEALRGMGIENPEQILLSNDDLDYGVSLNRHLAEQHAAEFGEAQPSAAPDDPRFSEARVAEFNQRCDAALEGLKDLLTREAATKPLTQLAGLLLRKYMQTAVARFGDSYTQFLAKDSGTDYLLKHGTSDEAVRTAQKLSFAENLRLSGSLEALARGDFSSADGKMRDIEQLILSDLCESAGYKPSAAKVFLSSLMRPKFSTAEKQELIGSLKNLSMSIDTGSFTVGDPRDGRSAFSTDLQELSKAGADTFDAKLKNFVSRHLTPETMVKADALLSYVTHDGDRHAAADAALKTAYGQDGEMSEVMQKVLRRFDRSYGARLGTKADLLDSVSKAQSEQAASLGKELLGNSDVRSLMRIATSYAAAQLGYAGRDELISAYQDESLSETRRNEIFRTVARALTVRGLDGNLAEMLTQARLTQGASDHLLARSWSFIKNTFFSAISSVQDTFQDVFSSGETKLLRRNANYTSYLPAVTEMLSTIGKDSIKYVDKEKEFRLNIRPFNAVAPEGPLDMVTANEPEGNGVFKLKVSLSLMKNSGIMITRGEDGRISLSVKASTLAGVSALVGLEAKEASDAEFNAEVKGGLGRVMDLKFATDADASVFICKMFSGVLTDADVRLAADAATGRTGEVGLSASAGAKLGQFSKWQIYGDEINTNEQIPGTDADEQFAEDHPVIQNLLDNVDLGALKLEAGFSRDTRTMTDNSGIMEETHRTWKLGAEFTALAMAGKYANLTGAVADQTRKVSGVADTVGNAVDKTGSAVSDALNAPLDYLGVRHAENYHRVHTSDITGSIDYATDTTVTTTLTGKDIRRLRDEGLMNEDLEKQLTEAAASGNLVRASFEMRLKESVITRYKNDPAGLARAAADVKKNYELSSFTAELSGTTVTRQSFDLLGKITRDTFNYTATATASGNTLIRIASSRL